jgi:hypothetical protein
VIEQVEEEKNIRQHKTKPLKYCRAREDLFLKVITTLIP